MIWFLDLALFFAACTRGANLPPSVQNQVLGCLDSAKVPQALPGTSQFGISSSPHNVRLRFTPLAIALPANVAHVQAAVGCGRRHGVKVNALSGGHNYASHGLGGEDGHLVIDLRNMNVTSVDPKTKIAIIGPGTRLGNMAIALDTQGKRALPHGLCPK
jgi:FAD/FMN-containing dehydrogenase